MTQSFIKSTLLGLLAVALAGLPGSVKAADTDAPALEKKAKASKSKEASKLPFHGKLKAVDLAAKTISVGKRTLQITPDTIITKGDHPATLDAGVVGEYASGSCLKGEAGKLNVVKLHFGPKPEAAGKPAKTGAKKERMKND